MGRSNPTRELVTGDRLRGILLVTGTWSNLLGQGDGQCKKKLKCGMEESWKGTAAFVATAYVATWVRYTKKPTLWVPGDHYTAAAERQHLMDVWDAKGVCDTEWLTNSKKNGRFW